MRNHLKPIQCSLLQALDVTNVCSINIDFRCPQRKNVRCLHQGIERVMLVVHHLLTTVPETCRLSISGLQQTSVVEHHYARTINESNLQTGILHHRVHDFEMIHTTNYIFQRLSPSLLRREKFCFEHQCGHFKLFRNFRWP